MTNLQKRIITSIILLFFVIIFNFTKLFGIGVLIVIGWICIEFSKMFTQFWIYRINRKKTLSTAP